MLKNKRRETLEDVWIILNLQILNKTKLQVAIFSKCVNNVNYNTNCVTLLKMSGSTFTGVILFGDRC
jgi:hypothetical protein